MKNLKRIGCLVIALMLSACGNLPTDGLTASMGLNQTEAAQSEAEAALQFAELPLASCRGEMNLRTNTVRISFESDALIEKDNLPYLFGGGTALLPHVPANANGTFRFRCESEGVLTTFSLRGNGSSAGWKVEEGTTVSWKVEEGTTVSWKVEEGIAVGLVAPKLIVDLPSGATRTVENVAFYGLLAPSAAEIPAIMEAIHGTAYIGETEKNLGFEAFFTAQKAWFRNYPDPAFMQQMALNGGMSELNAMRMGQLYAGDVADKQALLLDIVTSSDKTFIEAVAGATISTLHAAGLAPDEIAQLFLEETNGRITVKFGEVGSGPWSVRVTDQDDAGNVGVYASQESGSDSGSAGGNAGGGTGGDAGGGTGGDAGGGTGGDAGGGTGGDAGGGTGGDAGGSSGGNTGGGTDGGGKQPGGRTTGEFFRDLFWNIFQGAAAGAGLGAALTVEAAGSGALPGAALGGIGGALYTVAGGVWDPNPGSGSPCNSPIVFC